MYQITTNVVEAIRLALTYEYNIGNKAIPPEKAEWLVHAVESSGVDISMLISQVNTVMRNKSSYIAVHNGHIIDFTKSKHIESDEELALFLLNASISTLLTDGNLQFVEKGLFAAMQSMASMTMLQDASSESKSIH